MTKTYKIVHGICYQLSATRRNNFKLVKHYCRFIRKYSFTHSY